MDLLTEDPATPAARSVDAARGWAWWTEAWALFTANAGMWIVLGIATLVVVVVLGAIPLLGQLALALILPVLAGGWLLAARKVEQGGTLQIEDLFAGFKSPMLNPLMVVGGLLLAAGVVLTVVAGGMGMGALFGVMFGGAMHSPGAMMAAMGSGMVGLLVFLLAGYLIGMALWFAPGLVVFHQVAPVAAVKASFFACLKNIVPFVLWSIVYLVASVIASIPFGLGWVVLVPVLMLTAYVSWRDVFGP